jgi:hypothetical protein
VQVKVDHFLGVSTPDSDLMEILDVSGKIGTQAGKLRIIPGNLLEAGAKPLFSSPTRKVPIDLGAAYMAHDLVTVTLPANYTLQGLPKDGSLQDLPNTAYRSHYKVAGHEYTYERVSIVATSEYAPESYPPLKTYFQQVSQADQEPLVFRVGPAPGAASGTAAKAGGR